VAWQRGLSFHENPPPGAEDVIVKAHAEKLTHPRRPQLAESIGSGVWPRLWRSSEKGFYMSVAHGLFSTRSALGSSRRQVRHLHKACWTPSILKLRGPVNLARQTRSPGQKIASAGTRTRSAQEGRKQITCKPLCFASHAESTVLIQIA